MIHIGSQEKLGLQSFPTKSEELMLTRKLINFLCYESGLNQCTLSFEYHRVLKTYTNNKQRNLYHNSAYFCEKKDD